MHVLRCGKHTLCLLLGFSWEQESGVWWQHRKRKGALWDFLFLSLGLNASAAYMRSHAHTWQQSAAFYSLLSTRRRKFRFPEGLRLKWPIMPICTEPLFWRSHYGTSGLKFTNAERTKWNHNKQSGQATIDGLWCNQSGSMNTKKSQMSTVEAFHLCFWTLGPSWLAGAIWTSRCTQVRIQPGDITCAWRRLSVATAAAGHISLMFICLYKLAATSWELKGKSAGHRFCLCCPSIPLFLSTIVRLSPDLSLC